MQVYECILTLISGIGVFILAMKLLSDSLKILAGEKMKALLQKIAGNKISGVFVGALVTAAIHSSAATAIMAIGFVNANVMDLYQASAIIIGANIGTTTTGLLASLESLNISLYLCLFCFIGVMMSFIKKIKKVGNFIKSLGMIFVGLKLMSSSCNDESIKSGFRSLFAKLDFPLLLELFGLLFTALIQSSAAVTGLVIVMISKEAINIQSALFITLGANVGTCVAALIAVIKGNINSKRAAIIHLTFNTFGCSVFTPILWIFTDKIISILQSIVSKEGMQIAIFHLFFNCTTALITTPLIKFLVKFSKCAIKDKKDKETIEEKLIDNVNDISVMVRAEDSINPFKENKENNNVEKNDENDTLKNEEENNNEDNENNIKPSDDVNVDENEIKGKDL
jgi:phosphate:Na+ symporter